MHLWPGPSGFDASLDATQSANRMIFLSAPVPANVMVSAPTVTALLGTIIDGSQTNRSTCTTPPPVTAPWPLCTLTPTAFGFGFSRAVPELVPGAGDGFVSAESLSRMSGLIQNGPFGGRRVPCVPIASRNRKVSGMFVSVAGTTLLRRGRRRPEA